MVEGIVVTHPFVPVGPEVPCGPLDRALSLVNADTFVIRVAWACRVGVLKVGLSVYSVWFRSGAVAPGNCLPRRASGSWMLRFLLALFLSDLLGGFALQSVVLAALSADLQTNDGRVSGHQSKSIRTMNAPNQAMGA